ncbi:hypothetical protein [Bradyrhizobium ivorense]|uniref:hypothetical protein n=1 Tax=Bradyrhizobium ivorense TaxID=2511166 RepID=UPI001E3D8CDE|nr:hypothetical protein [Bradyrhizobium ivorense]
MIIATMIELAQRMLTNRPTVARTSESGIWPAARSPTRACEPRTEITRPKDVTVFAWLVLIDEMSGPICQGGAGKTVKSPGVRIG